MFTRTLFASTQSDGCAGYGCKLFYLIISSFVIAVWIMAGSVIVYLNNYNKIANTYTSQLMEIISAAMIAMSLMISFKWNLYFS